MSKLIDLTGQRFVRLVVTGRLPYQRGKQTMWQCACDCGNAHQVSGPSLKSGNTKSCGCLSAELSKERGKATNYAAKYWMENAHKKVPAEVKRERQKDRRACWYAENKVDQKKKALAWKHESGYVKKTVDELADTYVRSTLKNIGFPMDVITPELIAMKREQLFLRRLAKHFKQAATELKEKQ